MVLAIVGSRKWSDSATLYAEADKLQPTAIVSGGAVGADFIAEKYAADRGLPLTVFAPDLDKYGSPAAFHIRNRQIAELADVVLACLDGPSRGTQSTINAAKKLGRRVIIINNS